MSRQWGTLRRGSDDRGKTQRGLSVMAEEGYEVGILMHACVLIHGWEGRLVNERLAIGRGGGKINHYWLIKNMMGGLMEDMFGS